MLPNSFSLKLVSEILDIRVFRFVRLRICDIPRVNRKTPKQPLFSRPYQPYRWILNLILWLKNYTYFKFYSKIYPGQISLYHYLPVLSVGTSVVLYLLSILSCVCKELCDETKDLLVTIRCNLSLSCFKISISFYQKQK